MLGESESDVHRAEELLRRFKGKDYAFGDGALEMVGQYSVELGSRAAIITGATAERTGILRRIIQHLEESRVKVAGIIRGARPNTPKEDVYRMAYQLLRMDWDFALAIGGGSCLDGAKAALLLALYGGVVEDYFGVGRASQISGGRRIPLLAIQMASGSASHLTKYSNVTDFFTVQKKLIVDDAIIPPKAIFQYDVTVTAPRDLTMDGALDGLSHCWEVWMGATGKPYYDEVCEVASLGIKLILENLSKALEDPGNLGARYRLGLGTDLGGYSIMIGGTGAGHLGSFSLVDVLPHGRACAILNPYFTVLFSPAIQDQLRRVAEIYRMAGLIRDEVESMEGRKLGEVVARAMIEFERRVGCPTTLKEAGVTEAHLERIIRAARDPQLKVKLQNMPIPIDPEIGDLERLMEPTLYAAYTGNMNFIPELE